MEKHRIITTLKISILLSVSAFAFYLNAGYYELYFISSGYQERLSLQMSVFFITSEFSLWAFSGNKNFISILLKYGLIIFSIFATLSSQFTSTSQLESDNKIEVSSKIDMSSDIEYYREQIRIQDNRIDEIFNQRGDSFLFTKTEDSLMKAESEKLKYENLLSEALNDHREEIEEIYNVKSIYYWFSTDLPMILNDGLNENLIRVLFQLFSSFILAAMAPVCISILRSSRKEKEMDQVDPDTVQEENPKATEEDHHEYPSYTPPAEDPELSGIDKREILKMITYKYPDEKFMQPEEAAEYFKKFSEKNPNVKPYSVQDCRKVYDELFDKNLEGEDKEKIKEMILV